MILFFTENTENPACSLKQFIKYNAAQPQVTTWGKTVTYRRGCWFWVFFFPMGACVAQVQPLKGDERPLAASQRKYSVRH